MKISRFGICQICGYRRRLLVDHSHVSGLVRGLICYHCNPRLANIELGAHAHFRYLFRPLDAFRNSWFPMHRIFFEPRGVRPPLVLSLDDIEIAAIPCSLFHKYLETGGPLAPLNLQYREHMEIDV